MYKRFVFFLVFLAALLANSQSAEPEVSVKELVWAMIAQTDSVETLSFYMKKIERIDGELNKQQSFVKLNRHPFKVYSKQSKPNPGLEVLFVDGNNNNKATINPNGFPWINVKLDPYGSTMRDNQHHTIKDSGFDLFISIIAHLTKKYDDNLDDYLDLLGSVEYDGHQCWIISFTNPNYKILEYTVQEGENIHHIARERKLGEYRILELNEDVDDFDDVEPGQVIKIPNDYSPQLTLYVDKTMMLPLRLEVSDQDGLYELYEYISLEVNPDLKPEEFTTKYKEYGF